MRINCFGDSLTAGTAWGNTLSYPAVLAQLTEMQVNNYGIGGESSCTVASRIGAVKVTLTDDIYFKQGEYGPVPAALADIQMNPSGLLKQTQEDTGDDLVNPVKLGDCPGRLSRNGDILFFTRDNADKSLVITKGSILETRLSREDFSDDINIFWVGTNDYASTSNVMDVIRNIKSMIERTGSTKFIVIGMTALSYMPEAEQVNGILCNEFGEHFYDFRKYILSLPVVKEGNPFYKQDTDDAGRGEIPTSLIKAPGHDHVHGNEKFFSLLGAGLYGKLKESGCIR